MGPAPAEPLATYEERCVRFATLRDRAAASSRALATARLLLFLLMLGSGVAWEATGRAAWLLVALACMAGFIGLVLWHSRLKRAERWFATLRALNEEGLSRLARSWSALAARQPPDDLAGHAYAEDADLFGSPGLAQLLGPTGTAAGSRVLAGWLLNASAAADVRARQQASAELAQRNDLRDEVAAHARASAHVSEGEVERFLEWAENPSGPKVGRTLRVLAWVVPASTVALALAHASGWIAGPLWLLPAAAAIAITFGPGRAIDATLRRAFAREGMFTAYPELFASIGAADVRAPLLVRIGQALTTRGIPADRHIRRLRGLMHLADLRYGTLYLPVQLLTLWDVHIMAAVEKWRGAAGRDVRTWLAAVGEFEALAALATLAHDEPSWCFPEILEGEELRVDATALAHPMLPPTRVANDVAVGPPGTFLLVTGSNMSGKSTLLRALATNVVLGLAGAPVCARAMRLPVVSLQTSIRVADSVVRGVSYFMAQLQRMKQIVRAAETAGGGRPGALYLLDEILQGTNTAERRIAATRVIRYLIDRGAIGAVTTHDLELADEPALRSALVAVHFTETVMGEDELAVMHFDFRLRTGVATSTNALALMRMVGLDDGAAGG
jgi:hypothetical protein